jgi:hypothetical protein
MNAIGVVTAREVSRVRVEAVRASSHSVGMDEPETFADGDGQGEGEELPEDSYWDVVLEASDGELREDSYEFASLESGDLIVDDSVEESLSQLADAIDTALDAPYRAVAVRKDREWWSVSARQIRVVPLALEGERARLVSAGGKLQLEVDGKPAENAAATHVLASQAADLGDDYVVDAKRLDEGAWQVDAFAAGT